MPSLEKINFLTPSPSNKPYQILVTCWAAGFDYADAQEILRRQGYCLPEKQYQLFCQLLDTQAAMDLTEGAKP